MAAEIPKDQNDRRPKRFQRGAAFFCTGFSPARPAAGKNGILRQGMDIAAVALDHSELFQRIAPMFRDLNGYQPKRQPPRPERKYRQLSPKEEKLLIFVIAFNLLMVLFAPFCGSSVIEGIVALFRLL